MTDTDKGNDPNAALPTDEASNAEDRDGPRTQGGSLRKTPPPLPAFAQQAPAVEAAPPPVAKRGAGKTALYAVLVLAMLALAAAAGLGFGDLLEKKPVTTTIIVPPSAPSATATAAASTVSPAPSATTVTLPAVEIK